MSSNGNEQSKGIRRRVVGLDSSRKFISAARIPLTAKLTFIFVFLGQPLDPELLQKQRSV